MASSNQSSTMFGTSPTQVMPPDQYFANSHYANSVTANSNANTPGIFGNNPFSGATLTPNASNLPTPGSLAGRKRSRGDIHTDEEEMEPDGSLPTPASEGPEFQSQPVIPRGKPITGPDMQMIYPGDPSYPASAESHSTFLQESDAARKPFQLNQLKRPSFSSRKSQRMIAPTSESDEHLAQLVLPASMREATQEPLIDEATRTLGISWKRLDKTDAGRINQAAYSKFIINHYPALREVEIWLECSSLPGYLAHCFNVYKGEREFYIFSHDLVEGRLVTRTPADLIGRLQMLTTHGLHIAAPGGCIRAEMDASSATQNEMTGVAQEQAIAGGMVQDQPLAPDGVCSAHSMELD